jgi:hypothetical protein
MWDGKICAISRLLLVGEVLCVGVHVSIAAAIPTSPGVQAAKSICDLQQRGTQGHQVALKPSAGLVHVVWTDLYQWPPSSGAAHFITKSNSWSQLTQTWSQGSDGCEVNYTQYPQGPDLSYWINLDITSEGKECLVDVSKWRTDSWPAYMLVHISPLPAWCIYQASGLPVGPLGEPIFPKLDIDHIPAPGADVLHVAGCDTMTSASGIYYLVYWRFDGTSWSNPVLMDSGHTVSQLVVADPTTDEAAYVLCRPLNYGSPSQIDNDIAFYKSSDNGLSWVTSGTGGPAALTNVTNYAAAQNGRAYTDLSAIYDFNGVLHIVWNERRFIPPDSHFVGQCELVHWDDATATKRPIARAFWDNPASNGQFSMNLCKMTLGVGNGWTTCGVQPNNNHLYVTYTRFGGPTAPELADHSAAGYMNGETYLSISNDGGHTWSPPRNLTNTKTPGCNPATGDSCASEHWATIAKTVDDTIHISYILDRDAGAAPLGEGTWTYNPVMYYRIPGGTDGALCPDIAPVFEYLLTDTVIALPRQGGLRTDKSVRPTDEAISVGRTLLSGLSSGTGEATLTTSLAKNLAIDNYGNATLTGNVSIVYTNPPTPPVNWLTVGGAQTQGYAIAAGAAGVRWLVVGSNLGLDTGLYQAELRITHNDPHKPSPQVLPFQIAGPSCICPAQGDVVPDGVPDVFDVIGLIDYAFSGGQRPPKDPVCPHVDRGDVNCDGVDDVFDVVGLIDYVFSGGGSPCDPCACNPYPANCP